jgi:hypothetical protein
MTLKVTVMVIVTKSLSQTKTFCMVTEHVLFIACKMAHKCIQQQL